MYSVEYICTKVDIVVTTINMIAVRLSYCNPIDTVNKPESIHVHNFIYVGALFNPTSYNITHAIILVIIILTLVNIPAPFSPIFLPINPAIIALNNGLIIIHRYIFFGTFAGIRTPDSLLRRQLLYP